MTQQKERAVTPVVSVILIVAITVILAAVVGATVGSLGSDLEETPRASISAETVEPLGNCDSEVRLTHRGGGPITADNVLLVATKKVDIGGSGRDPNCRLSNKNEKINEGNDQAGIGDTWTAGESFRFGSNSLEGTTVRLVWTPEPIRDTGTPGNTQGGISDDEAFILYEETF